MLIALFAITIGAEIARELSFKFASREGRSLRFIGSPFVWLGFVFWAIEIIAWLQVLQRTPLNVAFPVMSLCYVGLPLASRWLLKETIRPRQWVGIFLVTLGVACVGLSGVG